MVMTQQPPVNHRRNLKDRPVSSEEEDYWSSSSGGGRGGGWDSARKRASPPQVAAAAAKKEEGLSLYEELLRYHRENPDEDEKLKIEEKKEVEEDDDDRKPAARPSHGDDASGSQNQKKGNKGTYRVPVSRHYFSAKSPTSSPAGKPKVPIESPGQLSIPNLAEWEDPHHAVVASNNQYSRSNYPSNFPEEMSSGLLDEFSFHDAAEDEALARQLQVEERERVEAFRRSVGGSSSSMPPLSPMTPSHRSSTSASDEALARHLSELSMSNAGTAYPAVLATPSGGPLHDDPVYHLAPATPVHRTPRHSSTHHTPTSAQTAHLPLPAVVADDEISKQETILREIMQENERKQLEWALKESKTAARPRVEIVLPEQQQHQIRRGPGMSDLPWQSPPSPRSRRSHTSPSRRQQHQQEQAPDWEEEQRRALEEFQRQHQSRQQQQNHHQQQRPTLHQHQHHTTGHIIDVPSHHNERYRHATPEAPRSSRTSYSREGMLQRGRQETDRAIQSGQARIVRCQACSGRLQAPRQYSLVYCPKCGHVSPVES